MPIFLRGLFLENYRGIGAEQVMTGFEEFNFFIGTNNAGKSTVLNFISNHLPVENGTKYQLNGIDRLEYHGGLDTTKIHMGIGVEALTAKLDFHAKYPYLLDQYAFIVDHVFDYFTDEGVIWRTSLLPYDNLDLELHYDVDDLQKGVENHLWMRVYLLLQSAGASEHAHQNYNLSDIRSRAIPEIISAVKSSIPIKLPETRLIPAIRQIGPTGDHYKDF
ncbi:MAG: hypothetical protein EOO38_28110, partial [Cytophagaceae bacterium]